MKTIGGYEVLGLLGKGGMSKVFKVRRPGAAEIMAMKVLSPHPHLLDLMGADAIRKRFAAEAQVMTELKSPHIVKVLDFGDHHDQPFIVMEYCCHNLGHVIGETYRVEKPVRVLRVDKAIRFARQILVGLSHLHDNGIVHRDIKPFNVLLTDDETVRLTDFGLSKVRGEMLSSPRQLVVGSPYYAAPEQEDEPDSVDRRADLYSAGVVVYRMLTGWLPMDGTPAVSAHNSELERDWDVFFRKAMSPARDERFPSAAHMRQALEKLHARWREKIAGLCTYTELTSRTPERRERPARILRSTAAKLAPGDVAVELDLDELWRPNRYTANSFTDNGDGTVRDTATGLLWEKNGSVHKMTWPEAHFYVRSLNTDRFAGKSCWRLPSIAELASLLSPFPDQEDYCIEPIFGRDGKWLWSSDSRSFSAAWYVSADMGYVSWQDFTCRFFVRAVCSG